MDSSFDLDIHNYTPNDLIKFFKLEQSYTLNDLVGKVAELTKEILSPNNTTYKTTYKNDIIKLRKWFINVYFGKSFRLIPKLSNIFLF